MNLASSQVISVDSIVRRGEDQLSSNVEDEMAIMSIESGKYYMLDEIGARFWRLIEEPTRIGDACAALLEEYDTDRGRCESDIVKLVRELLAQGLIEVVDAASS